MQAGTLNCPECGAAVSQDAPQCQYCHALLQTVACPKCLGMMFKGSKFCPHCGAIATQIAQGQTSTKSCPRCHVKLQHIMVSNTPLEECTRCGGLWIDVASFDHICSDADAQTAATGLQLPPPMPIDTHVIYLACPQCNNLMNRMNYAGRSGIIIGICRPHGIWLDRDEIRQIITFIRAGGLERARQNQIDQLQQEYRALNTETRIANFNSSIADRLDDHGHLLGGIASLIGSLSSI
jgi:Zn-finger nucleic acid-binding protein